MATTSSILEVKIRATIEGLKDVAALATEFSKVAEEALSLGSATSGMEELTLSAQGAASQLEDSFAVLGGRTSEKINQDILTIKAALESLKNSGAPFEVIAGAEEEAAIQIERLNAELSKPVARTFLDSLKTLEDGLSSLGDTGEESTDRLRNALNVLGNRSFGEIVAQIQSVKSALQSVRDSGASFEEIARATQLAESQIQGLETELVKLKIVAAPAAEELAKSLTPTQTGEILSQEIRNIAQALADIKGSGVGLQEISAAEELARTKTIELTKALQELKVQGVSSGDRIANAFSKLGGRTSDDIRAEIKKIQGALEEIKQSGASFEDIARASDLARIRISRLNQELADPSARTFAESLRDIIDRLREGDFAGAASGVNKLAFSFTGVASAIAASVKGLIILQGIRLLGRLISEATQFTKTASDLAARVETLGKTLTVVGRNAGYSQESLDKQEKTLKKLGITTESSRESLTKMIQAGIRINELGDGLDKYGNRLTKAGELARAAQDLAVVTGENSSQTLQRLVTNIQQMDTVGLRFLGLIVKREAAEAKFAATLGVTASGLSEAQKKQAFLNATLEEARKLSGAYEEAMETLGKKIGSLQRFQDEFTLSFGKAFTPAVTVAVDALSKFLEKGQSLVEEFSVTSSAASDFSKVVKVLSDVLGELALIATSATLSALKGIAGVLAEIAGLVSPVVNAFETLNKAFEKTTGSPLSKYLPEMGLIEGALLLVALAFAGVKDAATIAGLAIVETFGLANLAIGLMAEGLGRITKILTLGTLGQGLVDFGKKAQEAGQAQIEFAGASTKAFIEGDNAVAKRLKAFDGTGKSVSKATKAVSEFSKEIETLSAKQSSGKGSAEEISAGYAKISNALNKAKETGAITKKEFGALNKQLSVVPGTLVESYAAAAAKTGVSLQQLNSKTSESVQFGVDQMKEFVRTAASGNTDIIESAQSTVKTLGRDLGLLFTENVKGVKTFADLKLVNDTFAASRKTVKLTEKELAIAVTESTKKFDELVLAQGKSVSTRKDFEELKTSIESLGKTTDLAGAELLISADKIKGAVQSTALAFIENNSKIASTSVEVSSLIEEIERFGKEGVLSSQRTSFEVNKVTDAFIATRLKTAVVAEDFKKLTDEVKELGKAGFISGSKMRNALDDIAEAATGAKAKIKTISDQSVELADAALRISRASFEVTRAQVDVAKKRVDLWVAQNKLAMSGSDIDRLGVEIARLDLVVAEKQLALSRLRLQEQSSGIDLLTKKQELLNAVTALQYDQGNEKLQTKKKAAEDAVRSQEIATNGIKKQVDAQEQSLVKTQEAQIKAKGLQDILKTIEDQTKVNSNEGDKFGKSLDKGAGAAKGLATSFSTLGPEVAQSLREVSSSVSDVNNNLTRVGENSRLAQVASSLGLQVAGITEDYNTLKASSDSAFSSAAEGAGSADSAMSNLANSARNLAEPDAFGIAASKKDFIELTAVIDGADSKIVKLGKSSFTNVGESLTGLDSRIKRVGNSYQFVEDSSKQASDEAKKGLDEVGTSLDSVKKKQDEISNKPLEVGAKGSGVEDLKNGLGELNTGYIDLTSGTETWAASTISEYEKVAKALDELIARQRILSSGINIPTSSSPGFAEGGRIVGPGTGTSDSILLWGSNGEYMVRQAAVQHYGLDVMDRLNSLSLPRDSIPGYATGGLIGGDTTQNFTAINDQSQTTKGEGDTMNLDLSFNKKAVGKVRGSRDTVKALVEALREVQGSTR